jgi:acetoin utilization deacetylase AcuC-like enzyme
VEEFWLPALRQFAPQMIFVSAGFDAHRDDLLGGMRLLESDFAWITKSIMSVADQHAHGRVISLLEGGYDLAALGRSAVAHVRTLAAP